MKVYLAGPYASRDDLREFAAELRTLGCTVTSSWLDETHEINEGTEKAAPALSDEQVRDHALQDLRDHALQDLRDHALQDLRDVRGSGLLVLFTAGYLGCEGGGGRHIETGYMLALNKPVLVVGEPENVFHRMGSPVFVFPDWHAASLDIARRLVSR